MSRVARAVGNKYAIKMMGDFLNWVIVREASDRTAPAYKASEDVLFDATVYSKISALKTTLRHCESMFDGLKLGGPQYWTVQKR